MNELICQLMDDMIKDECEIKSAGEFLIPSEYRLDFYFRLITALLIDSISDRIIESEGGHVW